MRHQPATHKYPGDWTVDVKFTGRGGTLQANASGLLLVPPEHAIAFVTDPAGDALFRVVQRQPLPSAEDGSTRVEVVNKAAVRVLAWKIWTSNRVVYEIKTPSGSQEVGTADTAAANSSSSDGNEDVGNSSSSCSRDDAHAGCCSCTNGRTVSFQLMSSNMLNSLSGKWHLCPVKVHPSSLPATFFGSSSSSTRPTSTTTNNNSISSRQYAASSSLASQAAPWCTQPLGAISLQQLALGSTQASGTNRCGSNYTSSNGGSSAATRRLPSGLTIDEDGNILATLVKYEQYAQPKGMPPGVRFVPGMSDAVRMSIGREVRQMLDKINHTSLVAVSSGLSPQLALSHVCEQLDRAGGSFKKLRKLLDREAEAAAAAAAAAAAGSKAASAGIGSLSRSGSAGSVTAAQAVTGAVVVGAKAAPGTKQRMQQQQQQQEAYVGSHPLLLTVQELRVSDETGVLLPQQGPIC